MTPTHTIPELTPSKYNERDKWQTEAVLVVPADSFQRFTMGFIGPEGTCRRVDQGPIEPGPYAYAFGKAAVLDQHGSSAAELARKEAAGLVIRADHGDLLDFHGHLFRIEPANNRNVDLVLVDGTEHDLECTGCEHDCPWRRTIFGAPWCSICDDHNEAAVDE